MKIFKNIFKPKKNVEEEVKYKIFEIICPYCFEKYLPEDVKFRATHVNEEDQDYQLSEDIALNNYREKFGLDAVEEMEAIIDHNDIPDEDKEYSKGILIAIRDKYGIRTSKRICPSCHNELPISAGKSPSNIISIVGASQAGKSVYMTSLIYKLETQTANNFNAACIPISSSVSRRFKEEYLEPLFERGDLLASTQKEKKQEPFIFEFKFKNQNKPPAMLVFFDVAGEGMTDQDYLEIYASHIKNSSGILFLVDPLQIKTIRDKINLKRKDTDGEFTGTYDEPRDVIINLYENYIGHEEHGKTEAPTAVIITKSDMLNSIKDEDGEYIKDNSNVFNDFNHKKVFDLSEFNNINGEITRFIDKVDRPFKDALEVNFDDVAYFAVSALGCNPKDGKVEGLIEPLRVDEPFLWLLYKLNYIGGSEKD